MTNQNDTHNKRFDKWIAQDEGVNRLGLTLRDSYIYGAREGWQASQTHTRQEAERVIGEMEKVLQYLELLHQVGGLIPISGVGHNKIIDALKLAAEWRAARGEG